MDTGFIVVLAIAVAILLIQIYVSFIRDGKGKQESDGIILMQQQLQELARSMREQLSESNRIVREGSQMQFQESRELIAQINREVNEQIRAIEESVSEKLLHVQRGVSEVSESSKQVFTLAEQLQNLEKVLKHQKQRGNLGEASLQLALENMLPATAFKLQYQFPGGDIVDAVVLTKDGMIPVDAKFSLDNYRRLTEETNDVQREALEREFKNDLKKRIDETSKYIRPKDGTLPFAFMYIPAEAIYYDLLVNEVGAVKVNTRSLIDYAYTDKNVIIVSPTTFAAYLQSVLYGFRAFRVEESAKEIQKNVEKLSRHLNAYTQYFEKLGTTLGTTVNHYNAASKELGKIDKDVMKISGESIEATALELERPLRAGAAEE
jgi:DNA recombination protein RmuC